MINLVVNKIGGSILKSPNQLNRTVATILANQTNSIIVVSALYGVTDKLIKATQENDYTPQIDQIKRSHLKWLADSPYIQNLEKTINEFQQIFHQLHADISDYKRNYNAYTYARILSAGERLASVIISHYFNGIAEIILPENIGLRTNDHATKAEYINIENKSNVLSFLDINKYIIPGFYGVNESGQHCLSGRGGSDYTAAYLAQQLSAEKLIFWKDSNGIQTANPEIVANAENVALINLHVLNQMSHAGSKILHPKVTDSLSNFSGKISFRNPLFGNQILTHIQTKKSSSGKAIIIDSPSNENPKKCSISIITRNRTAAVVAIQQLKNTLSGIQILDISDQLVTFQIRTKNRSEAIRILHDTFHNQQPFSILNNSTVLKPITICN